MIIILPAGYTLPVHNGLPYFFQGGVAKPGWLFPVFSPIPEHFGKEGTAWLRRMPKTTRGGNLAHSRSHSPGSHSGPVLQQSLVCRRPV